MIVQLSKFLQDSISFSKGSVKIPLKSQIETYREKYDKLTEKKQIKAISYKIPVSNRILYHAKIPSSSLDKFFYDVVLELSPTDKSASFEDCEVQFFSNSPSFVYGGYAYLFYHMDVNGETKKPGSKAKGMMIDIFRRKVPRENLLVPKTERKLGKEAVGTEPEVRNPLGIAIPDSSIYYAIFHLIDHEDYNRVINNRNYHSEAQILSQIEDFDHLMVLRKKQAAKEADERRKKRESEHASVPSRKKASDGTTHRGAGIMKPKSPTRAISTSSTVRSMRRASTNRNKSGGVNRIG